MTNEFRQIASVDKMLQHARIKELSATLPHDVIVDNIRQQLAEYRAGAAEAKPPPPLDTMVEEIRRRLQSLMQPSLAPIINATGVVLHTNLGRAPLSRETIAAMQRVSAGYCNIEIDLANGKRGSRQVHLEPWLRQLTGAEAALVVNNCASALLLALTALAKRKEVIVSRSQAVEIGGGFRIPDVMRQSGAKLIEVGTTNCTYARDYEEAITPRTAALLRVHSSNFKVIGFTHAVTLKEMVDLGQRYNVPVLDDLGSGCLIDTTRFGLNPEPTVQESIQAGTQLACFSGDKLLGGPQAGIIVGTRTLVEKLKKQALSRALRIDKLRIAGLTATLLHYWRGEALSKIPIWRMIAAPVSEMERRATAWAAPLGSFARVIEGESMIGGGSLPGETLPTRLLALQGNSHNTVESMAKQLRWADAPVIGRINGNVLLLDPRSVLPEEDEVVERTLNGLAAGWRK